MSCMSTWIARYTSACKFSKDKVPNVTAVSESKNFKDIAMPPEITTCNLC